jgi:hypothetical protein
MFGRFKSLAAAVVFGTGILASVQAATAAPLTWTFADVAFDDGGTLSGSFDFDADATLFSNINISVEGGNATFYPDFTYTELNSSVLGSSNEKLLSLVASLGMSDNRSLFMDFESALTNAGGTIGVLNPAGLGGASELRTLPSSPPFGQRGFLPGGTISAIPEPSSTLFVLAFVLGAAAFIRWRAF